MTQKPRILFVEDDEGFRDAISSMLEDEEWGGYKVIECENQTQAKDRIIKGPDFALALIDMIIPTEELGEDPEGGLEVIKTVKKCQPDTECIVLTGHGSIDNVVKAMQLGASNYLVKTESSNDLILETVRQALENWNLRKDNSNLQKEIKNLKEQLDEDFGIDNIICKSKLMLDILGKVRQVAPTNATVLITGESGTGKGLIAKAIRKESLRKDKPLVELNCAALSENLIESELFGHERGAFTGANERRIGKFEQADKGTIFLDEIGDMSLRTQAKVLRVLEEGKFERVGGEETIQVDVRVIAATNKNLEEAIKNKEFREDLYHRLNVFPLQVPPLKERKEDIPLLVHSFIEELGEKRNKSVPVTKITKEAMSYLKNADWSGNVRELRYVVERAIILTTTDTIDIKSLSGVTKSKDNFPDTLYRWATKRGETEYIHLKRYVFIRAINEETRKLKSEQELKWKDIKKRIGISYKKSTRIKEVIKQVANEIKFDDDNIIQKVQKGKANDFLNKAIEYYESKLSLSKEA